MDCLARIRDSKVKTAESAILPSWQKNFIIGIDDCIFVVARSNRGLTAKDIAKAEEVPGAREWIKKRYDEGHNICFLTTLKERLRTPTETWLKEHDFKYHSLIMNRPKAQHYHYIDDRHVQATTFQGKFAPLVKKEHKIQVFG